MADRKHGTKIHNSPVDKKPLIPVDMVDTVDSFG